METLETWDEFVKATQNLPRVHPGLSTKYLCIKGYFNEIVAKESPVPESIPSTAATIEEVVTTTFPYFKVVGVQTPKEPAPDQIRRYGSQIVASDNGLGAVYLNLMCVPTHNETEAPFGFRLLVPVGDPYSRDSGRFLNGIWHFVRGIEYAEPNVFVVDTELDMYGLGHIVLVANGDTNCRQIVATGVPALKKARIELPEKDINLCGGYARNLDLK